MNNVWLSACSVRLAEEKTKEVVDDQVSSRWVKNGCLGAVTKIRKRSTEDSLELRNGQGGLAAECLGYPWRISLWGWRWSTNWWWKWCINSVPSEKLTPTFTQSSTGIITHLYDKRLESSYYLKFRIKDSKQLAQYKCILCSWYFSKCFPFITQSFLQ